MIEWTDEIKKQYRTAQFFGTIMLIVAPILYIVIPQYILKRNIKEGGEFDIMLYILIFLGIIQPLVIPLLEKSYISTFKKKPNSPAFRFKNLINPLNGRSRDGTPMGLYISVIIVKAAIVESIYLYGFVNFMLTGDLTRMLYFYPIGIAWSILYFPTKSRCLKFLEKVKINEPV